MFNPFKYTVVTVALYCFSVKCYAQDLTRQFKDPDNAFTISIPSNWKENKPKGATKFLLTSTSNPDEQLFLEEFVLAKLIKDEKLEDFADDLTKDFTEERGRKGSPQLNSSYYEDISGMKWWVYDFNTDELRCRKYVTFYNGRRFSFSYVAPDADFEKDRELADKTIRTFLFTGMDQQKVTVSDNSTAPTAVTSTVAKANSQDNNILSVPATTNKDGLSAGDIAPDAIKMEVDEMGDFFGKFAVIRKNNSQALINDKGEIVIPYNTYMFHAGSPPELYEKAKIGRTFYTNSYYGRLAKYQKDAPYVKLIGYWEFKNENDGYITMSGQSVVRIKNDEHNNADWLNRYDMNGYFVRTSPVVGGLTEDGLLVFEKYDGTTITGKGNFLTVNNKGRTPNINYAFERYSQEDQSTSSSADGGDHGSWVAGLSPARYLDDAEKGIYTTPAISDPIKRREIENKRIGFVNRKGIFQIKPDYYSVSEFSEGLSFVSKIDEFGERHWGAIDTTGKLVIPYKFKLHPGRFSFGLSIIKAKDLDNINYGFINKKGEIVFTIPKKSGDTLAFELGMGDEFYDNDYPRHYKYDGFYFMEGYQFMTLTIKDPSTHSGDRREVFLIDTLGSHIPIEELLKAKLPNGSIKCLPPIRDGKFIFEYQSTSFDVLGMADVHGNIVLQPKFVKLSLFEKESNLQFAQAGTDQYNQAGMGTEGYIDRNGIFRIIKVNARGGF